MSDKCPDPVPAAPPKVDPKPPAAESIVHAMSDREERIEKAHIAFTQHLDWEKDEEHGGIICSECGWSFGEMPVEPEARQLHALRAAAPFLESSPAPDEVVVSREELETVLAKCRRIYGSPAGDRDNYFAARASLRAALREQEQS